MHVDRSALCGVGQSKRQLVRIVIDPSLSLIDGQYYAILNDGLPTIIYHAQSKVSTAGQNDSITFVELKQPDYNIDALISPTKIVQDLAN